MMELYRPLDIQEFRAVEKSGFRKFPARTPEKPIFTVLLSEEGASRIASHLKLRRTAGNRSFVVSFHVDDAYIRRFPVHGSDGADTDALWIPAEELNDLNDHLLGSIQVRSSYEVSREDGNLFFA